MSLTPVEIRKIASLAHIKMGEEEVQKYCTELNKIFSWIEQLNEVNTDNIASWQPHQDGLHALRVDSATEDNHQKELMEIAPKSKYGYYVVPKVVE